MYSCTKKPMINKYKNWNLNTQPNNTNLFIFLVLNLFTLSLIRSCNECRLHIRDKHTIVEHQQLSVVNRYNHKC